MQMVDNDCFVKKRGNDKIFKLHLFYNDYETSYVIQLIIIMLVCTDFCVPMVFLWEETVVPTYIEVIYRNLIQKSYIEILYRNLLLVKTVCL